MLRSEEERIRRDQVAPMQDRGNVDLKDWQARACQGPSCCYRHLHWQEAGGSLSIYPQHGRSQRPSQGISTCESINLRSQRAGVTKSTLNIA